MFRSWLLRWARILRKIYFLFSIILEEAIPRVERDQEEREILIIVGAAPVLEHVAVGSSNVADVQYNCMSILV